MRIFENGEQWEVPGLLTLVKESQIKNYFIQIFYSSGERKYVLFIQSKTTKMKPYEKHFIPSIREAWNEAVLFVNKRIKKPDYSLGTKILRFLKGMN